MEKDALAYKELPLPILLGK